MYVVGSFPSLVVSLYRIKINYYETIMIFDVPQSPKQKVYNGLSVLLKQFL